MYEEDLEEEPVPNPPCPTCEGPGVFLGCLGSLQWFRCRNCGAEYNELDAS